MKSIFELLYTKYISEIEKLPGCPGLDEECFTSYVSEVLNGCECVDINDNGNIGVMFYRQCDDSGVSYVDVPVFGYYAQTEKMTVMLFQKLAEKVCGNDSVEFSVRLYAHDEECIRAFHMMQFGNMSEKSIRKLERTDIDLQSGISIRPLDKTEIEQHWSGIWSATEAIIAHLRTSPVFYPGNEFTEDVYREFYTDDGTELIAAFKDDDIVGIIEWNREGNRLLCNEVKAVNVGEVYVRPEYRGEGLAEALLRAAKNRALEAGFEYMWVEHGTANPNARGFWNKYFHTYEYELVRRICVLQ